MLFLLTLTFLIDKIYVVSQHVCIYVQFAIMSFNLSFVHFFTYPNMFELRKLY